MAKYVGFVTIGADQSMPIAATLYGVCGPDIAIDANPKLVTLDALTNITAGVTVRVKFIKGNNKNDLKLRFTGMPSDTTGIAVKNYGAGSSLTFAANSVISFTYDGTNWVMHDANTTYSTLNQTIVNAGTETTGKLVTAKIIKDTVTNAINDLDVTDISGFGADQTLQSLTETDGKISATFQDISIPWSKVTSQPTLGAAAAKGVDTSISAGSTSANLPTTAAVASFVSTATSKLSGAMHFKGSTTSTITDGGTETVSIGGSNLTPEAGDVVLSGNKEFVWTSESKWEELGDEGSYALKTITVTGSNGLIGGGAISSNQVISHAARDSSITSDTLGTTGTARTYIKSITLDAYGHVTGVGTGTENVTDTKVTQNILATTVTDSYPILLSNYKKDATTTAATTANRIQAIYVQPSTGTLFATKFSGDGSNLTNVTAASVAWENVTDKVTAAQNTLGLVKTSSGVTSTSGLTAAPIIDGIVYYKDTDTHYTSHLYVTNSSGTTKTTTALTNGNVYLKLYDNTAARESYKISGSGGATVTTDASGNIIITSKTYGVTGSTTINYLNDANYVKTASVSGGTLTITTIDNAPTITAVTAIG